MTMLVAAKELIGLLGKTIRGPKRNGVYATWLIVRFCDGLVGKNALQSRTNRHRLLALEKRLTSLSLTPAFRKALSACLKDLQDLDGECVSAALHQLSTSCHEDLGPSCGGIVMKAARKAKTLSSVAD